MTVQPTSNTVDSFTGFVLGMAVGDAIGLPREGLSRRRAERIYGTAPLRHRLFLGRGMVSDDTEHMRMTAAVLLREHRDPVRFGRVLAWKLRWWMVALPAGTGMATARAIIKLWLGWSASQSGVWSAGNGPAMRSGVLGLCLSRDTDPLDEFVRVSTRMTHTDPRAETGAMLIALAAREAVRSKQALIDAGQFLQQCRRYAVEGEWQTTLIKVEQSLQREDSAKEFAESLGMERGVGGYIVHTVAAVLFCWLRWPGELRRPIEAIVQLGGDTDSTAAILGGLVGAANGPEAIPQEWLDHLIEWPHSVSWMRSSLAQGLRTQFADERSSSIGSGRIRRPLPSGLTVIATLARNLFFLAIVLVHGFRRLLPPY